jgi:fermentation-respiration switch protein FrsA (DUF1100 family)
MRLEITPPPRASLVLALGLVIGLATPLIARSVDAQTAPSERAVLVRGKKQVLRLYGPESGPPVVVTSGDGGWMHVGPQAAEWFARQGYFVVGVDAKAYLASFTAGVSTLSTGDVPADYRVFVDVARAGRERPVLLVGGSLGAGLSVLAASSPDLKPLLTGVITLGLPNDNELGWRFRDSLIYITKKVPNEPLFHAEDYIPSVPPVPLAGIHSTHDEFVPVDQARRLFALPGAPKRLWIVDASNHRFSGNAEGLQDALRAALSWVAEQRDAPAARR